MDLIRLKRSRKPQHSGDVFVFQLTPGKFYFGRVITTSGQHGSTANLNLLYFYNVCRSSTSPIPELDKRNLLFPPILTTGSAWTAGYLQTIGHLPLQEADVFPVHCFKRDPIFPGGKTNYFDEYSNLLDRRYQPCGVYGITTKAGINADVKRALGIPVAGD